jgi:hypothetical protein
LNLPDKDFAWTANAESSVKIDESAKVWRLEARIPLLSLSDKMPVAGTRWKINLYRHDKADGGFLAASPTLRGSFHAPDRFGWLEFVSPATN